MVQPRVLLPTDAFQPPPNRLMPTPTPLRTFAALLALAACPVALTAQGTPVGFEETFALAKDRAAVVAELIPGTADYYYYRCRERLDARDFATVREVLPTWIKRHGRTERVIEIENREALLSYGQDQGRTYAFLRDRLKLRYEHQRAVPGAPSDLPSRLDPALIDPAALTKRALKARSGTVKGFHPRALARLANTDLNEWQLHSLLSLLKRPDIANLPALIIRDLGSSDSRGFGSLGIHKQLRIEQLDQCQALRPELLQDRRFVDAYLTRLQPSADASWRSDPAQRGRHLQQLWGFASRLNASFNSLKAHVLYHWLRHDLKQGAPNKERFLEYIRLPRRRFFVSKSHLDRHQRNSDHVDLNQGYPSQLAPIQSDAQLIRAYLEQFFQREDTVTAYSDFLDQRWLEGILAETKLLSGQGDQARWYSLLDDPARLEQLEQRVELRFPPDQESTYGADDAVKLQLDVKNVSALVVKVFAVDAYRYHVERQEPVDASIDLDGVVANFEQTYEYADAPIRRVRRTFDLPMLNRPGTYVVDFVGNGISSRAVVYKGQLRMVARTSAAGQLVRVYDERGAHVPDALAWFGGREYGADDRGEILIPFSTSPGSKQLVLRQGERSTLAKFRHQSESYRVDVYAHLDRESLIAGNTADLLLRPELFLAGHPVSIELLEEPLLTIIATDLDGKSTTQEVRDLELVNGREFVHQLRVPLRTTRIEVALSGHVEAMSGKDEPLSGGTQRFSINQIDTTAETGIPMLLRTPAGYGVELRGKNGELQAGRVCLLELYHRDYKQTVKASLQTDEAGRIMLGRLPGIERVDVRKEGGENGSFELNGPRLHLPAAMHGAAGETLRVPYQGSNSAPSRAEFSLLSHSHDAFDRLGIASGFLELRDLEPGDYELWLHESGERVTVRVTRGQRDGQYLIGRDRALSSTPTAPLHVLDVSTDAQQVRIRLANATADTRVHVVATRYLPAFDLFDGLRSFARAPATVDDMSLRASTFDAGRKLSDEYRYVMERRFAQKHPGNMLERPTLLLNPLTLPDLSFNEAIGLGGGAGGKFGGRGRDKRGAAAASPPASAMRAGPNAGLYANLDFLPRGSRVLSNLSTDEDGFVTIPTEELGEGHQVHVLALDGAQAVYDVATRAEQSMEPRSRQLPAALSTEQDFIEKRRIEFVASGSDVTIDAATAPEVEVYDTLASVFQLFTTIRQDSELQKFAFVLEWPSLSRDQKLALYSEHACHELHFFLHEKDPDFFTEVVRPFLANKLDKTFLDEWMLERDLVAYLEPWKFAHLNLVEKILLARRLGGEEPAAVARMLREALELNPIDERRLSRLFDLQLLSTALDSASEETSRESAFDSNQWNSAIGLGGGAGSARGRVAPKPVGPATAGPAGPPNEAAKAKREQSAVSGRAVTGSDDLYLGSKTLDRETRKRKSATRLYQSVERTRLLIEHNYWQRGASEPTANVIEANQFWVDFANASPAETFVSTAFAQATGSFVEMMFALSALDLPYDAGEHQYTTEGMRRTLTAASPLLLVRKEIAPTDRDAGTAPMLLGQNFFRLNDRYRWVNGEQRDAFVTNEFLVDVAYGCQVVVTNPTSSARVADVLLQVPAGAVPLQRGIWTRGHKVQLAPYATQTIEYAFYFPATGSYEHYPAHAAEKGQLAAVAMKQPFNVVAKPSEVDTSSWEHVSQQGTPTQVLSFLDAQNVQRLDLTKLCWRLRDRAFYEALLPKLRERHAFHATVWSYGLLHRDPQATREYLRHRDDFLDQCGSWLDAPLAQIDAKERLLFRHLELSPLVHQRAHQLGSRRLIGNQDLAKQYSALMEVLGYQPTLSSKDWLAVTYYFLLQDRVDEALAAFDRVEPDAVEAKVQYDYLSAYLCFFTGDVQKARRVASKHEEHVAAHWRTRFREVLAQLDEAEGKTRQRVEEQSNDTLTATAPALELAIAGRGVAVSYKNLREVEVRYYELDVEFAFSTQPFAGPDGASAAFVKPNFQETRALEQTASQLAFELPQQFWQKNMLVEVRAGGLVRSRQYFANALDVRFLESYGQVAVTEPASDKPLAKTYVKVFARMPDGAVRFHKDGYTDLRGRFDYVSLSDDPNRGAQRYAVLVLDEERGAVIREINPPAR